MFKSLFGGGPPAAEEKPLPEEPKTGGLLARLKQGIQKTRAGLVERIEETIQGKKEIDADLLEELEYALLGADIGVRTSNEILERIRQRVDRKLVGDAGELKSLI